MKSLNASIMACFLDIVQILIDCPDNKERLEKIDHLRWLFINFHQIINELRPIEAMHCLYVLQQQQNANHAEVYSRMSESIMKCQSALVSIDETMTKLPDIPLPPIPEFLFEDDNVQDYKKENMAWVLEDALGGTLDKVLLNSIKNARDEMDENGYILKYWKEPPKESTLNEKKGRRFYFRDKVVRIKDAFNGRKMISPPPAEVQLLESSDDEEESENDSSEKSSDMESSSDEVEVEKDQPESIESIKSDQEEVQSSDKNDDVADDEEKESDTNMEVDSVEQSGEDDEESEEDSSDEAVEDSSESEEDEDSDEQEDYIYFDEEEADIYDLKEESSDEEEDDVSDEEEDENSKSSPAKVVNPTSYSDDDDSLTSSSDDKDEDNSDEEKSFKELSSELEDQQEDTGLVQQIESTETAESDKNVEQNSPNEVEVEDVEMKDATEADDEDEDENESEDEDEEPEPTPAGITETPKHYSRKAFGRYVRARGVAPDLDREVLAVRNLKRKLRERIEEIAADRDDEDFSIVDDVEPCSSTSIPEIEVGRPINRKRKRKSNQLKTLTGQWCQIEYVRGLSDSSDLSDDSSEASTEEEEEEIASTVGKPGISLFDDDSSVEDEDDDVDNDDGEEVDGSSNIESEQVGSKVRSTDSDPTEEPSTTTSILEIRQSPRPYSALEEEAEEDDINDDES
uniref:Uncharacterized protein n=1 Tax=Panagrolaimus sp. JU765 TaxID=591449 RepID=A0AC34QEM5_9BILA